MEKKAFPIKGEPNRIISNDFRKEKLDGKIPLLIPTVKLVDNFEICEMMKSLDASA